MLAFQDAARTHLKKSAAETVLARGCNPRAKLCEIRRSSGRGSINRRRQQARARQRVEQFPGEMSAKRNQRAARDHHVLRMRAGEKRERWTFRLPKVRLQRMRPDQRTLFSAHDIVGAAHA
jgi:hypothetical protein